MPWVLTSRPGHYAAARLGTGAIESEKLLHVILGHVVGPSHQRHTVGFPHKVIRIRVGSCTMCVCSARTCMEMGFLEHAYKLKRTKD